MSFVAVASFVLVVLILLLVFAIGVLAVLRCR